MSFNRAELDNLERRELQLTVLSAVIVLILAGGAALLMYPLVFVHPDPDNKWNLRIAFVGFCALSLLFVGYLLDRHFTVRELKKRLLEELNRNLQLRDQANVDVLQTIPDLSHFSHRLAQEFRRATAQGHSLSLLLVKVTLEDSDPSSLQGKNALGEAARAIARRLRPSDSIYQFGTGLFGVVLPELEPEIAHELSLRVEEFLLAVGETSKFSSQVLLYSYPKDVSSVQEMQEVVSALLPGNQTLPAEAEIKSA